MHVRLAAPRFAVVTLFASMLATGYSGSGSSKATEEKSPPPSNRERAYYGCLEKNGVALEDRDDGQLRVDKDKNDDASLVDAQAKCAELLPDAASASPAPDAVVAKAKKFSACVRENGFPEYPDPDLATGEVGFARDRAATYRTAEFATVAEKCSPGGSGGGIVGG